MAGKKKAIGDLIKNDMSRRVIGDGSLPLETAAEGEGAGTVVPGAVSPDMPAGEKVQFPPAKKPERKRVSGADAELLEFIAVQSEAAGLTEEEDRLNFYAFLRGQSLRYLRGFDAGRRFRAN